MELAPPLSSFEESLDRSTDWVRDPDLRRVVRTTSRGASSNEAVFSAFFPPFFKSLASARSSSCWPAREARDCAMAASSWVSLCPMVKSAEGWLSSAGAGSSRNSLMWSQQSSSSLPLHESTNSFNRPCSSTTEQWHASPSGTISGSLVSVKMPLARLLSRCRRYTMRPLVRCIRNCSVDDGVDVMTSVTWQKESPSPPATANLVVISAPVLLLQFIPCPSSQLSRRVESHIRGFAVQFRSLRRS
mmetsp:Transcript_34239/g.75452  ORF Transcript_34239/g.75452 Transcript_34239/m.75452 type:complete len:245 (-) Transcript_34239:81-815(-)